MPNYFYFLPLVLGEKMFLISYPYIGTLYMAASYFDGSNLF